MRQNSPFVRGVVVCFLIFFLAGICLAQKTKTTEGSLRAVGPKRSEIGLCPLKRTGVQADISGFISRVTVTQVFQNPVNETIEAVYTFPLPNDAAVDALTIETGGRIINGRLMERQKAKQTYEAAKQDGKVAALLEQERPDIFTQSVANITPGAEIKVVISYVETLHYADDTYEFTFPMTIGERYIPAASDPEGSARISPGSKARPGQTILMEINIDGGVPITGVQSATHEIEVQQYSAGKYAVRLKDAETIPNRDFVLRYKTAGSKIEDAVLAHHDDRGGFFTLILQPPDNVMPTDTMPKEIVFVLDTSGSMDGFPIKKAREAMKLTLDNLNPYDTFNLITFAGDTHILFEKPLPATKENLAAARRLLDDSSSGGGTEMMKAIQAALEPSDSQSHVRIACFMTDGQVSNESEIIKEVRSHPNARVFAFGIGDSVNHNLLDNISREGRGEVEYVAKTDDGSAAARRFFERIRNPLMTDIALEFSGVDVSETYPVEIPDLFDTKPVTITGRYKRGGRAIVTLKGMMLGQPFSRDIAIDFPKQGAENEVMATLWARKKLADTMRPDFKGTRDEQELLITGLGLDYHLLTPFTSFVAVEEGRVTDGTPPRRIEVPVAGTETEQFIENYWRRRDPEAPVPAAPATPVASNGSAPGASAPDCGVCATVEVVAESNAAGMTSTVSNTVTEEVSYLPLNGRSYQSLTSLAPGVTQVSTSPSLMQRGLISSNGQQPTSNQFTVDGVDANRGLLIGGSAISGAIGSLPELTAAGGTNLMIGSDAIQEIVIRTFPMAVEGRTAGATINVASKAGTNMFHGSLFETFGNAVFNAADPFARAAGFDRAPSRLHNFGGTQGGFVVKDRLFYFGNYEGLRLRQGAFGTSEVPSATSRLAAPPDLRPVFDLFPLSNGPATSNGFSGFSSVYTNPAAHDIFGLRVDTMFTDKFRVDARYNFADSKAAWRGPQGLSLNTLHSLDTSSNSLWVRGSYVLTPYLIFGARSAFSKSTIESGYSTDSFGGGSVLSLPSADFLRYDLGGRASVAASKGSRTAIDEFQIGGTLDWVAGKHIISLGADLRRLAFAIDPLTLERNVLFEGAGPSGNAARIGQIIRSIPGAQSIRNFSGWGQDVFRPTSRVSLNLGLRWDMDFAPATEGFPTALPNTSTRIKTNTSNLAPRASVTIDAFGNGRAVIRAGVGLYYDFGNLNAADTFTSSFPYASGAYVRGAHFASIPANPLKPLALFDSGLKTPRTWQIFTEYQHEIFDGYTVSASYVAAFGRDLLLSRTLLDADPVFNAIRLTDNSGTSDFQALNLRLDHRFSNGFSFNTRYTLSRSRDNISPGTLSQSNFIAAPDQEKGASDFDARHTIAAFGAYNFRTPFRSGIAKWLTRDWSLQAQLNARSAFPVNVTYAQVNDLGVLLFRPDLVQGVSPITNVGGHNALDPAAFAIPAAQRQGSLQRNSLRGFALVQLNAGVERRFKLSSASSLRLSVEGYNVLNTVNFENMESSLGTRFQNGTFQPHYYFGKTVASLGSGGFAPFFLYGGPRTIQFSARFAF